jgi:hypothetical protein
MATATRTRKAGSKGKASARKNKNVITAKQAWEALGADEQYKPKDLNASASNRMLWALNEAGKLSLNV